MPCHPTYAATTATHLKTKGQDPVLVVSLSYQESEVFQVCWAYKQVEIGLCKVECHKPELRGLQRPDSRSWIWNDRWTCWSPEGTNTLSSSRLENYESRTPCPWTPRALFPLLRVTKGAPISTVSCQKSSWGAMGKGGFGGGGPVRKDLKLYAIPFADKVRCIGSCWFPPRPLKKRPKKELPKKRGWGRMGIDPL